MEKNSGEESVQDQIFRRELGDFVHLCNEYWGKKFAVLQANRDKGTEGDEVSAARAKRFDREYAEFKADHIALLGLFNRSSFRRLTADTKEEYERLKRGLENFMQGHP
ncbi:hypothetical protein HYW59_01195 [Candidatus Kaiserbacteria bacterium]|nr:hypothetical protein [Candidatus Kaiserbacteria bacterium]